MSNLLIYNRKNRNFIFYGKNAKMKSVEFSELTSNPSSNIVIVNCMSARRPSEITRIREANYAQPISIFEKIRTSSFSNITWVQPESYWQYAVGASPDDDYLYWKKELSGYLQKQSQKNLLHVIPFVLCHLIGPDDDINRFIPRLVRLLRTESKVEIVNPNETLYLSDVNDVANFLSTSIKQNLFKENTETQMFPYQKATILELVNLILEVIPEKPRVSFITQSKQLAPRISEHVNLLSVAAFDPKTPLRISLKRISDKLNI